MLADKVAYLCLMVQTALRKDFRALCPAKYQMSAHALAAYKPSLSALAACGRAFTVRIPLPFPYRCFSYGIKRVCAGDTSVELPRGKLTVAFTRSSGAVSWLHDETAGAYMRGQALFIGT